MKEWAYYFKKGAWLLATAAIVASTGFSVYEQVQGAVEKEENFTEYAESFVAANPERAEELYNEIYAKDKEAVVKGEMSIGEYYGNISEKDIDDIVSVAMGVSDKETAELIGKKYENYLAEAEQMETDAAVLLILGLAATAVTAFGAKPKSLDKEMSKNGKLARQISAGCLAVVAIAFGYGCVCGNYKGYECPAQEEVSAVIQKYSEDINAEKVEIVDAIVKESSDATRLNDAYTVAELNTDEANEKIVLDIIDGHEEDMFVAAVEHGDNVSEQSVAGMKNITLVGALSMIGAAATAINASGKRKEQENVM